MAESTQARIDQAVRDIVMGAFDRAYRILEVNRDVLERCARELLARETLDENDISQLAQGLQTEYLGEAIPQSESSRSGSRGNTP